MSYYNFHQQDSNSILLCRKCTIKYLIYFSANASMKRILKVLLPVVITIMLILVLAYWLHWNKKKKGKILWKNNYHDQWAILSFQCYIFSIQTNFRHFAIQVQKGTIETSNCQIVLKTVIYHSWNATRMYMHWMKEVQVAQRCTAFRWVQLFQPPTIFLSLIGWEKAVLAPYTRYILYINQAFSLLILSCK